MIGLDAEIRELVLELRETATTIEQGLLAAGPCRVGGRVDVEVQRVAFLAVGRTREIFGAVGHDDLDRMIIGMDASFHRSSLACRGERPRHALRRCHPLENLEARGM